MHHSLIPFLLFLLSLPVTYTIFIPIQPPDIRHQERIESFEAQKPLPTSALLAGAASSSFPSPLPVGSHPLVADPVRKQLISFDEYIDDMEDLRHEMDRLKAGMMRVRGKLEDMERKAGSDDEVGNDDDVKGEDDERNDDETRISDDEKENVRLDLR